jgi:hypothetical protein
MIDNIAIAAGSSALQKKQDLKCYFQFSLLLLVAGTIYPMLYLRQNYELTVLDAFRISKDELENSYALMGVIYLIAYGPSGWLADKMSAQIQIPFSLALVGVLGLWFASFPDKPFLPLIFAGWGIGGGFLGNRFSNEGVLAGAMLLAAAGLIGLMVLPQYANTYVLLAFMLFIGTLSYTPCVACTGRCWTSARCRRRWLAWRSAWCPWSVTWRTFSCRRSMPALLGMYPGLTGFKVYYGYIALCGLPGAAGVFYFKKSTKKERTQPRKSYQCNPISSPYRHRISAACTGSL